MIHINTQGGQIGRIWWLNTNPIPVPSEWLFDGTIRGRRFIQWGTVGLGDDLRISYEEAP